VCRLAEKGATRRRHHQTGVVEEQGKGAFGIGAEHRDLAPRAFEVALERQVLDAALEAREVLKQALARPLESAALGARDVVEDIHRAQDRGEGEEQERDRTLERGQHGHRARAWSGPGASSASTSVGARRSRSVSMTSMSLRAV